eukprot:c41681_g1_i1.p1 GENE.c41681_g1_i1~~c41681_g1_i1.p1  ORF type:complete len:142 (-),score=17.14 c41681_g1_i1:87-476(-)
MADIFDTLVNLESESYESGRREAQERAKQISYEEGEKLGKQNGSSLGEEMGYYAGFCRILGQPNVVEHLSTRARSVLSQVQLTLEALPATPNAQDETFHDTAVKIRGQFRQLLSLAKLSAPRTTETIAF